MDATLYTCTLMEKVKKKCHKITSNFLYHLESKDILNANTILQSQTGILNANTILRYYNTYSDRRMLISYL